MGLFGSKKIYVSSSVYNMAGDINERPGYLKTLVASHVILGESDTIAGSLTTGYLKGPGLRIKSFGRWAATPGNYPAVGVVTADFFGKLQIEPELIEPLIPLDPGQTINMQRTEVQTADYSFWSEQWMLLNAPELLDTLWTSDLDEASNEITITFEDDSTVTFTPDGFDPQGTYLYVLYNVVTGEEVGGTVTGPDQSTPFPITSGWTAVTDTSPSTLVVLERVETTTATYSDDRPDEGPSSSTSYSNEHYPDREAHYYRVTYMGEYGDPLLDQLYSLREDLYLQTDVVVTTEETTTVTDEVFNEGEEDEYVKTTTVHVSQEVFDVVGTWRIDETEVAQQTFSPSRMLIYRLGSGGAPAIDAKMNESTDSGYYMPFIPVRLNNQMVDASHYVDVYAQSKKAYKKMTGSRKYDKEVKDPIADHEKVGDMDYVYVMLGASLNSKENAARKYMFEFFDRIRLAQTAGSAAYNTWLSNQDQFEVENAAWVEWRLAQSDPGDPLYGTPMPVTGSSYTAPSNEVRVRGNGTIDTNVDMRISWNAISRSTGSGLVKPGSKTGDCYVEFVARNQLHSIGYNDGKALSLDPIPVDSVVISLQQTATSWVALTITGLMHRNYIYKGKNVETTAKKALEDDEESGFLVPIHQDVFSSMSIVDYTQFSTACCYMVVNAYVVKKTGFFGSFFFKILMFVAVVAITVATGGTGAASVGLLGSNASIGAALGLTGFIGILVGALANAIAAIVVAKIITAGATAIFGDKIGALIGAIVSIAAIAVGVSIQAGNFSMSTMTTSMSRADNIIAMTSAVGNGIAGYVQAGALETAQKTRDLEEQFRKKSREISDLYEQNFGYFRTQLDPLYLFVDRPQGLGESPSAFLERTLMTGTDVVELTHSLVSDFADITLASVLD